MRPLLTSLVLLFTAALSSCGGGGPSGPADVIRVASVTRAVLLQCLRAPSSLDELLLGCLAGTVSTGVDATGTACSVNFSASLLQIASAGFQGSIAYQRGATKDTAYVYERSYDPNTGAFNFAVNASSGGAAYFGFSFTNDPAGGNNNAIFGFEVAPTVPGGPKVSVRCAVQV